MDDTGSRGAWILGGDPHAARAIAGAGFDWVAIDLQHGRIDDARAYELLLATAGTVPRWVRVGAGDAARIGRALDAGADGVIVPQVQSADEAAAAVRAARYPPHGDRSWGPLGGYGTADPGRAPLVAVMVETAQGLADVDAIAAAPGVDLVLVGPFDLALALGDTVTGLLDAAAADPTSPLARIRDAVRAAGVRLGAFAGTPAATRRFADLGYDDLAVATDALLVA